jgi:hypothetical protein
MGFPTGMFRFSRHCSCLMEWITQFQKLQMTHCPQLECHTELKFSACAHTQSLDQLTTRLLTITFLRNGLCAPLVLSHAVKEALNKSFDMLRMNGKCLVSFGVSPSATVRQTLSNHTAIQFVQGIHKGSWSSIQPRGAKHGRNAAKAATAILSLLRGRRPPRGNFRLVQQTAQESGASQTWA